MQPLTIPLQIAVHQAREILDGSIPEGEKLSEYQLAERFGVSRGPVREAITILERNCLVRSSPRLSARVNSNTREDVQQLFEVRGEVLGLIARYAARNRSDADVAKLTEEIEALARQEEASPNDVAGFFLQSHRCWMALIRASRARTISHINSMFTSSPIWQIVTRERLAASQMVFPSKTLLELWRSVAAAVVAGDEDGAYQASRRITVTAWTMIRQSFPEARS